jgi:aminopeptidase N
MKILRITLKLYLLICLPIQLVNSQIIHKIPTDVLNYSFKIDISDLTDSISVEEIIEIIALSPYHLFELDLENKRNNGKGMTVSKVVNTNGEIIQFYQKSNKLVIENNQEVKKDSIRIYKICYGGIPSDGLIISKNRFGKRTFFADNWPERARCWLACNDFPTDKATVNFSIIAPSHYSVIANGRLTSKQTLSNETTIWNWKEEIPISTKVMVFGAADFAINIDSSLIGIPVETWVYINNKKEGFLDYSQAKYIVNTFQSMIGKYPYEKLANIQSTTIYGGMENASCIFYAENSVTGKDNVEALLAHEIAHQWFGNSITECSWSHLWLSEGFATFFANIYCEKRFGKDSLLARLIQDRQAAINWPGTISIPVIPDSNNDPRSQLNPVTYEKAGWILYMLKSDVGDTSFFRAIRKFYSQYANKTACTQDFKKIVESISGKDLDTFFTEWLYRPGFPNLKLNWHYNAEQKILQLSIVQLQQELFSLPLEILASESSQLIRIAINDRINNCSIKMEKAPGKIIIDPGTKVFAKFFQQEY